MEEYPGEFSRQAKARVEQEKIKAWKAVGKRSKSRRWEEYERLIEYMIGLIVEYIIQVSRAFTVEVCKLSMEGRWDVDQARARAEQFPGTFAKELSNDTRKTVGGYSVPVLMKDGALARILAKVEESAKWRPWLEGKLLAVAEDQASDTLSANAWVSSGQAPKRPLDPPLVSMPESALPISPLKSGGSSTIVSSAGREPRQPRLELSTEEERELSRRLHNPTAYPALSVKEAAAALGKSVSTIYRWVDDQRLTGTSVPGRIKTSSVLQLLKKRERDSADS